MKNLLLILMTLSPISNLALASLPTDFSVAVSTKNLQAPASNRPWHEMLGHLTFQCLVNKASSIKIIERDGQGIKKIEVDLGDDSCADNIDNLVFVRQSIEFKELGEYYTFSLFSPNLKKLNLDGYEFANLTLELSDRTNMQVAKSAYDVPYYWLSLVFHHRNENNKDYGLFVNNIFSHQGWVVNNLKLIKREIEHRGFDPRFPDVEYIYQREHYTYELHSTHLSRVLYGEYTTSWNRQ